MRRGWLAGGCAWLALWLAFTAPCATPPAPPAPAPAQPQLDAAQRGWLRAHPTWIVGMTRSGWPPYEVRRDGQPAGLSFDYLSTIAERLGARLQPREYDSWPDLLAAACRGEVDVVMSTAITVSRTRCLAFSRPYQVSRVVMVGRADDVARLESPTASLRVAVEAGHAIDELLPESYPGAQVVQVGDTRAALAALRQARVDAYFGNAYAVAELLREPADVELRIIGPARLPPNALHFATPNDRRLLAEAIDKALDTLTPEERQAIDARWLDPRLAWTSNVLQLSDSERAWLRGLPVLRVAFDPTWAPLTPRGPDGRMSGVLGDYLQRMQAQLGIRVEAVPARDWRQARALIEAGMADIAPAVGQAGYGPAWHQTQPLVSFPCVIVTRQRAAVVADLRDLAGRHIAVSDPDLGQRLARLLPGTPQVPVASDGDGLRLVEQGRADAYIGNLASVDNSLRELQSLELRVAAPAGFSDEVGLAVRDPYAPLAGLFDRVAADIGEGERQAIRKRWLQVDYDYGFARPLVLWSSAIALVIIALLAAAYTRLRAEIAGRREADARLRDIARNLPAVVFKLRRSPAGELNFVHVTGNPQPLFALDAAQIMQDHRCLFDRVDPADHIALTEALEESARTLQPLVRDFRSHGAQGWRWTSLNVVPRRTEDGAVHWSGYWADATAIHEQNAALESAREAAVAAATAKSNFLAVMSHEIRTPMAGLAGMLELLARTPLGGEQRQLLSTSIESAAALRQILDDILDFSKAEAGEMHLESIEMDLRQIVGGVLEVLGPAARQQGLALRLSLAPALAARHLGDPFRLRQVLLNLVGNAIKFTHRGHVEVAVEAADEPPAGEHGDQPPGQRIRLRVTDTGVGIPRAQQARLFRPFVQADATTTRHHGGTGLGLSICQQLVDLMGGQIHLDSSEGVGTRVEVELRLPVLRRQAPDLRLVGRVAALEVADPALHAQLAAMLASFGIDTPPPAGTLPDVWITDHLPLTTPAAETLLLRPHGQADGQPGCCIVHHDPLLPGALQAALLALLDPAHGEPAATPSASPARAVPPLLVVEDHPTNRMLIARQLEALGYPCIVTADGAEALAALRQHAVSLVITDISMPRMDGHTLAARIRADEAAGNRMPIIAMTANVLADRHDDPAIDAWLHKPVDLQALEAALATWLPAVSAPAPAPPFGADDPALLHSFLETTRADLDALEQALQRDDAAECGRRLHRMAGALGHFGHGALAIAARDLDEQLRGHTTLPAPLARQVGELLARLRQALDALSPQAPPADANG